MSAPERSGMPIAARSVHGTVPRDVDLSTEILEYLDRCAEHRCPELAGCLLEELAVRSEASDCELERCTCFNLLRHWFGIDRRRRSPCLRLVHVGTRQRDAASRDVAS